jgi:hypothetical protein
MSPKGDFFSLGHCMPTPRLSCYPSVVLALCSLVLNTFGTELWYQCCALLAIGFAFHTAKQNFPRMVILRPLPQIVCLLRYLSCNFLFGFSLYAAVSPLAALSAFLRPWCWALIVVEALRPFLLSCPFPTYPIGPPAAPHRYTRWISEISFLIFINTTLWCYYTSDSCLWQFSCFILYVWVGALLPPSPFEIRSPFRGLLLYYKLYFYISYYLPYFLSIYPICLYSRPLFLVFPFLLAAMLIRLHGPWVGPLQHAERAPRSFLPRTGPWCFHLSTHSVARLPGFNLSTSSRAFASTRKPHCTPHYRFNISRSICVASPSRIRTIFDIAAHLLRRVAFLRSRHCSDPVPSPRRRVAVVFLFSYNINFRFSIWQLSYLLTIRRLLAIVRIAS